MKIVCDHNMPMAKEAFATLGDVTVLDGRSITPADVADAEILAIRSTTKVHRALLDGSRVRFVGTATIGTDHMDIPHLEERGIRWCSAAGCNANSVSEYLVSALLHLACRHGFELRGRTIGIVGVGNVGRRVAAKAEALGMRALLNDPPRRRAEDTAGEIFVPLARLAAESDIVTFHVPLTKSGVDRTVGMADSAFLASLKPGCILINAARGPVLEGEALLAALASRRVAHAVLDTWEGEPGFRSDLLAAVDIGTPHIAGHSYEGKVMGTVMVYREACAFLGVSPAWSHEPAMPAPPVPRLRCDAAGRPERESLWEIVRAVYDVREDDRLLRAAPPDPAERARYFDKLRKDYPVRREFTCTTVELQGATADLARTVTGIGFALAGPPGAAVTA